MDLSEPPKNGTVIRYAYLWRDDRQRGLEEGRKDRPAAVLLAKTDRETKICTVLVLPVTHTPPIDSSLAIEVSPDEARTMGLDEAPSWIVCNEVNIFVWPGFDVRPTPGGSHIYGKVPRPLYDRIRARFLELSTTGRTATVTRE